MPPLYLDYNASTPIDPRIFDAMKPWLTDEPGNAGSRTHAYGQAARDAVETARSQIADLLTSDSAEIVFTSGATESNNLAILGLAEYGVSVGRRHIVSAAIEHKSVLDPLARLSAKGFEVDLAPVATGGYVDPDEIRRLTRPDTLLVSVMHANNETGILQPVEDIAQFLTESGVFFHVDAAQTFGKEVACLRELRFDLLSISGHKIYGPKGVGALCIRNREARLRLTPLMFGGGQERGLRPGTVAVALAVGLGTAAAVAKSVHRPRHAAAAMVKQQFVRDLAPVQHRINGDQSRCQPHVLNLSFPGIDSEALMMALRDEVAISNGSACTSTSYAPSHVLKAMGLTDDLLESAVRISWGPGVASIPASAIVNAVARLKPARSLV